MNYRFLGHPPTNVEYWMKTHEPTPPTPTFDGDIFTKYDGTIVKVPYDETKTTININLVDDYQNVKQFDFGKSYTEIVNLARSDANEYGVDLSRTKIESFDSLYINNTLLTSFSLPESLQSFNFVSLDYNQLTSFSLPESLQSFNFVSLRGNQLTSFSLPESLQSFNGVTLAENQLTSFSLPNSTQHFDSISLDDNWLTSFSLPASLQSFEDLYLDVNCILDMTHITDGSQIPEIQGYGIESGSSKENTIIKIKDESMESVFKTTQNWEIYQYIWD